MFAQNSFQSTNGPYTYEKGDLRQPQGEKKMVAEVETQDPEVGLIRMDDEYYAIEIVFEVAMTQHNFERGNIFVQSQFNSYRKGLKPLIVSRTGFLNPQSSLKLMVRDIVSLIPYAAEWLGCPNTQFITIKIFDKFDNDDFGLESIDFLVPHEALQFKQAQVNVRTGLYGVRYIMYEWFFTCAVAVIFLLTSSICIGVLVGIAALK